MNNKFQSFLSNISNHTKHFSVLQLVNNNIHFLYVFTGKQIPNLFIQTGDANRQNEVQMLYNQYTHPFALPPFTHLRDQQIVQQSTVTTGGSTSNERSGENSRNDAVVTPVSSTREELSPFDTGVHAHKKFGTCPAPPDPLTANVRNSSINSRRQKSKQSCTVVMSSLLVNRDASGSSNVQMLEMETCDNNSVGSSQTVGTNLSQSVTPSSSQSVSSSLSQSTTTSHIPQTSVAANSNSEGNFRYIYNSDGLYICPTEHCNSERLPNRMIKVEVADPRYGGRRVRKKQQKLSLKIKSEDSTDSE